MKSDDRIAPNIFFFRISRYYPNEQLTGERHSSTCQRFVIKYQAIELYIRKRKYQIDSNLVEEYQILFSIFFF